MGMQSARMFFHGKDHKDVYFQGSFHKAMYKGDELVWQKLVKSQLKLWVKDVVSYGGMFYLLLGDTVNGMNGSYIASSKNILDGVQVLGKCPGTSAIQAYRDGIVAGDSISNGYPPVEWNKIPEAGITECITSSVHLSSQVYAPDGAYTMQFSGVYPYSNSAGYGRLAFVDYSGNTIKATDYGTGYTSRSYASYFQKRFMREGQFCVVTNHAFKNDTAQFPLVKSTYDFVTQVEEYPDFDTVAPSGFETNVTSTMDVVVANGIAYILCDCDYRAVGTTSPFAKLPIIATYDGNGVELYPYQNGLFEFTDSSGRDSVFNRIWYCGGVFVVQWYHSEKGYVVLAGHSPGDLKEVANTHINGAVFNGNNVLILADDDNYKADYVLVMNPSTFATIKKTFDLFEATK